MDSLFCQQGCPPSGIFKEGIASVQYHISFFKKRNQLFYDGIHRFACLDHQHYLPGTGKGVRHVLKVIKGYQVLMRMVPHDLLCDSGAAVITAHLKSVISHIQGKTSSHNGKTYDSNIKFYHSATSSGEIWVK